jgi:HD-GYP domain-containing protein (c-di-GMP phosphodiesterase class II)
MPTSRPDGSATTSPSRPRGSWSPTLGPAGCWDGKGAVGAKGEQIRLVSRLVSLADVVAVYHRHGGLDAAVEVAKERSGTAFDPSLVDLFCSQAEVLLSDLDAASGWDMVIGAEPQLELRIPEERFDDVLEAVAEFVDLKSPFTIGHSRAVAELAAEASRHLGGGDAQASACTPT